MDKLPAMPPDPETEIQDLTRDECRVIVDYEDYAALRSVALAYLEALRISVQHMEDATEYGYDRRMLDVLEYIGKLPERAV